MRRVALVLIGCCASGALLLASDLRVTPLAREGQVYVSFQLSDGFTEDVRAAIHSGLTTTFSYEIELRHRTTLWFDHTLGAASVSASVKYDTLTRKYNVTRALDGRIERADMTDNEEAVRAWLTRFAKLPLFSTASLEPNVEYYLRVQAHTTPRTGWFLWPWDWHDASGQATFTFLP